MTTSPTTATPFSGRSSRVETHDPDDERDQRAGDPPGDAPEDEDPDDGRDAEDGGVSVDLVEALDDGDAFLDDRPVDSRDPEQGRDLADR